MSVIEKDNENIKEIEELYLFDAVLFENTVLITGDVEYSICYVAFDDVYDICIQDIHHTKIIEYRQTKKLTDDEMKFFNLLQSEVIVDEHDNITECVSHSVEYVF
ncbi:MAG: hypothetical protein SOZ23_01795 [Methanosphaera sp.]|uniref:hypothetical protein n=1 Tax=Methanosphaera sp. TaxID=2666342 RepID=UPI0025EE4159|nr:hypothetical protein [Methanosphaera sp.]MCI5866597.1 hypothetical protein [Methanosphaera sp.]MDD6535077.1 hypothetical protein [Methanosphaera sp.]MDY3955509.1 hypothetical protein [Methanosphaera sp.]